MKNRPLFPRMNKAERLALTLLLLAGLFLANTLLAPAPAAVQALNAPAPAANSAPGASGAVSGTIASFAALFPQISAFYLPLVTR
jgi:hypothetical protein